MINTNVNNFTISPVTTTNHNMSNISNTVKNTNYNIYPGSPPQTTQHKDNHAQLLAQ